MTTIPQLDPVSIIADTDVVMVTHSNGTTEKLTGANLKAAIIGTLDSMPKEGSNKLVSSNGIAKAFAVSKDATLHYSFDDVPDLPDGTADYLRKENFANADGWAGGSNTVTATNGVLTVANVATNYIYKSFSLSAKVVILYVLSSVDTTLSLYATVSGTSHGLMTIACKAGVVTKLCGYEPSAFSAIGILGLSVSGTFKILEAYIGDGSYTTPIIDNSGDNINATNNGGIAVQGVCGKGLYLPPAKRAHIPNFHLTTNFTVSMWVKPSNNTSSLVGYLFANWAQLLIRNGENNNDDKLAIVLYHSNSSETFYPTNALLTPNVWNNIVVVKEDNILTVFINGVKYTKTLSSSSLKMENLEDSYLGSQVNTRPQAIDDLLIFSRALSADEVQAIYLNKANTPKFYNLNNYKLPSVPSTDGIYNLQCTVSNGVSTYAWVAEENRSVSPEPEQTRGGGEAEESNDQR